MVAAAVIGSAVVGGVAQSYAGGKAASAQKRAAGNAINAQQGFFNTSKEALQPYLSAGQQATQKLSALQGIPYTDENGNMIQPGAGGMQKTLESLPGYQFSLTQGLKSVQNGATARGLGVSGAAQKGAADYATGLANSQYGNYLTGLQNTANTGAGAGGSLAGVATQSGGNIGTQYGNIGQAGAAGSLSQGAAFGNIANSVPNALLTNRLLSQGGGGSSSFLDAPGTNNGFNGTWAE